MLQIQLWKRVVIWGLVAAGLIFAMPNAFYTRVERHNDAVAAIALSGETPELAAARDGWPGWLPGTLVSLGLDLDFRDNASFPEKGSYLKVVHTNGIIFNNSNIPKSTFMIMGGTIYNKCIM